jgi:bifunctional DNA-binding transcriptional regulator/antitoxin component of YhaV-PrlF toxin-antitoxin module
LSSETKKEEAKTFIAKVQEGYRVQIPEPLRIVMNITPGDIVEVTVKKVMPKPEEEKT